MPSFRQKEVINPHLRLPLQFGGLNGGALVNEQDTPEDIVDCIKAIIAWPVGTRHDMPEFGVPDLLFRVQNELKVQELRNAIEEWEERATIATESGPVLTDDIVWNILIKAGVIQDA